MKARIVILVLLSGFFCYGQADKSVKPNPPTKSSKQNVSAVSQAQFDDLKKILDSLQKNNLQLEQKVADIQKENNELKQAQRPSALEVINNLESTYNNRLTYLEWLFNVILALVAIAVTILTGGAIWQVWKVSADSDKIQEQEKSINEAIEYSRLLKERIDQNNCLMVNSLSSAFYVLYSFGNNSHINSLRMLAMSCYFGLQDENHFFNSDDAKYEDCFNQTLALTTPEDVKAIKSIKDLLQQTYSNAKSNEAKNFMLQCLVLFETRIKELEATKQDSDVKS